MSIMRGAVILGLALAAAACQRASAVRTEAQEQTAILEAEARATRAEAAGRPAAAAPEAGQVHWASSRRGSGPENARRGFERNGEAFGVRSVGAYVRAAETFIDHPPAGAETLTRANGDRLIYDPKTNTFAVAARDGTPRALFKPDDGKTYWDEQKAREGRRQAAQPPRGDRG